MSDNPAQIAEYVRLIDAVGAILAEDRADEYEMLNRWEELESAYNVVRDIDGTAEKSDLQWASDLVRNSTVEIRHSDGGDNRGA